MFLCPLQIMSQGKRVMGPDWMYVRGCNDLTMLQSEMASEQRGKGIQSKRVSRPHCKSVCPADVGLNLSLMP